MSSHAIQRLVSLFFLLLATNIAATPPPPPPPPSSSLCTFEPTDRTIKCPTDVSSVGHLDAREIMQAQIRALQSHLDRTVPLSPQPPPSQQTRQKRLTQTEWETMNGTTMTIMETASAEDLKHLPQNKTLIVIAVIVVSMIVMISVVFEKWHAWLDENVPEVLTPVLKSIFGELTVLGFIGLIMFVTTKAGKKSLDELVCGGVKVGGVKMWKCAHQI